MAQLSEDIVAQFVESPTDCVTSPRTAAVADGPSFRVIAPGLAGVILAVTAALITAPRFVRFFQHKPHDPE